MSWEVTHGMPLQPHACASCGGYPRHEDDGETPKDAYFAGGVDIDFGNALYLCEGCVNVLVELRTDLPPDEWRSITQERDDLRTNLEELNKEHEALNERIKQILAGEKAKKEVKKGGKSTHR